MDHNPGRACYEKNVSAKQFKTQPHAWISSPHGNQERPTGIKPPARQGPSAVDTVASASKPACGSPGPHGFPRSQRLTTAADFSRVFAKPRRSSDQYFTVLARDNGDLGPRLGLAISRRRAKHAVQRNRIKRLARDAFRQHEPLSSCDFVVLAGAAAAAADNGVLRGSLERHFARLTQLADQTLHG
jgi:ribonuclease P protein component